MNLDALIKAERNAPPEATHEQSRAVWTSIERSVVGAPLLAPLAASKLSALTKFGAALSTTTGKVVLATAIVAGGTAGALSIPAPPNKAPTAVAPEAPPKTTPKTAPKAAPKAASRAPAPAPPPVQVVSEVPIQRPTPVEPQRPKNAAPVVAPTPEPEPEPEPEPDATADLEHGLLLIKRAEKAMKKGKHDVALAFLRRHRALYPDSPLVEHREALFVQALCEGDLSLAAKARWEFNRKWPESRYRDHLREICLEPHSQ